MLDIAFIRDFPDKIRDAASKKGAQCDVERLLEVDKEKRALQTEFQAKKALQNQANDQIAQAQGEEKKQAIEQMKSIAEEIKAIQEKLTVKEEAFMKLMLTVPNLMSPEVPLGKDDTENVETKRVGKIPRFDFKPKDHIELMEMHDMIDVERGVKLTGARGYFLKNEGMLLEQAILQHALKKLVQKGFTPLQVPYLVNPECLVGTGYFPGGEDDAYHLERDDKWLIATAEIPATSFYSGEVLSEEDLPKNFVALSPCFRREAGSYGKDTKGLYRIHQFQKVEQVVVLPADEEASHKWYDIILQNACEVVEDLELPYRILQLCTGDMALGKHNSCDIECYMPSRESYGETHSATEFLDFQARRLKMRYKDVEGNIKYCYTLNNTVVATPRILISLLECHQKADGSIAIPKALQAYMGKEEIRVGGK